MMLVTIEKSFNLIWHVLEPRKGLQRFLLYWGVMTFGPPLLVAGTLISSYLISLPLVTGLDTFGLKETLLSYMPVIFSTAAFTVLYYAVPNTRVPFKHALLGGFITMILFEQAKNIFTLIVAKSNLAIIYGAFAAAPLFLSWLYLVWALVLIGAILVRTFSMKPEANESQQHPPLIQCRSYDRKGSIRIGVAGWYRHQSVSTGSDFRSTRKHEDHRIGRGRKLDSW